MTLDTIVHLVSAVTFLTGSPSLVGKGLGVRSDLVFTNGNFYTVDAKHPRAEAVAVRGGRFVFVGSARGAKAFIGKTTRVIDLRGATVVPGLTDSHYHLTGVGERELTLNLEGTTSLQDFLSRVKERV